MNLPAKALIVSCSLLLASTAHAQSFQADYPHGYFGADAFAWDLGLDGTDNDFNSIGLRLVAGMKLDDYLVPIQKLITG